MDTPSRRFLFLLLIILPYILILIHILSTPMSDSVYTAIRTCGLLGFVSLSLAVIMNILKTDIRHALGSPFLPVHHIFGFTGLFLITLHPVLLAAWLMDPRVFIPVTDSLMSVLVNGGRVALIIIYIALLFALFRNIIRGRWKLFHQMVYPALLLGAIHANLLGSDLSDPLIMITCDGLLSGVILTWILKWRKHHLKRIRKKQVMANIQTR